MNYSELFTKPMQSNGYSVPPETIIAAISRWNPSKGYRALAGLMRDGRIDIDSWLARLKVADRVIQKLRKAGLITHLGGGKWAWVQDEKEQGE